MANLYGLLARCFGWESSDYGNTRLEGPRPPSPPKLKNTASACVMEALRGSHHFTVAGYSLTKDMPQGEFLSSDTFSVGGCDWAIHYYPSSFNAGSAGHIGFTVVLKSDHHVKASFECLIRCPNGSTFARVKSGPKVYDHCGHSFGCSEFVEKAALEASDCIEDDRFIIVCNLSVIRQRRKEGEQDCPIVVPPSNYQWNFGRIFETGLGADVTFNVGGKMFPAHRCVLAAQSPVFQNVLYGPMREKDMRCITIEGIESEVFGALLYFVYNDSLPEMEGSAVFMAQHLLEAADRYGLQRLKLICEKQLYEGMHVDSVVSTLVLADQHQCVELKAACLDFIVAYGRLDEIIETDEYKHLLATGHPILNELVRKLGSGLAKQS